MDVDMDTKGFIDDARPREETTMIYVGVDIWFLMLIDVDDEKDNKMEKKTK